jgi:hypothetical protein
VIGGLYADHGTGEAAHQAIFLGFDTTLTASLLALLAGPLTASALQLLAEPGHRCLQRKRRNNKLFFIYLGATFHDEWKDDRFNFIIVFIANLADFTFA